MRERVAADYGFVGLDHQAGEVRQQPAGGIYLLRVDTDLEPKEILAGVQGHYNFFQRSIAGAFTDPVDGAFDLPGAMLDGGERIGHGKPEVIVTVHGKSGLSDVFYMRKNVPYSLLKLGGNRVAHGV